MLRCDGHDKTEQGSSERSTVEGGKGGPLVHNQLIEQLPSCMSLEHC